MNFKHFILLLAIAIIGLLSLEFSVIKADDTNDLTNGVVNLDEIEEDEGCEKIRNKKDCETCCKKQKFGFSFTPEEEAIEGFDMCLCIEWH